MCRLSMQCQVWTTVKSKSNWTIFNLRLISPFIESHQKTCLVSWHLFERTLYIIDHHLSLHVIFIYNGCWNRPTKVLSVKKENYLCVWGGHYFLLREAPYEKQFVSLSFDPPHLPLCQTGGFFIKALNQFMHLHPIPFNGQCPSTHFAFHKGASLSVHVFFYQVLKV